MRDSREKQEEEDRQKKQLTAAQEAKEKKEKEEREKKEREEKKVRDEELKIENERKDRLYSKLQSLSGASTEDVPVQQDEGFIQQAQKNKLEQKRQ